MLKTQQTHTTYLVMCLKEELGRDGSSECIGVRFDDNPLGLDQDATWLECPALTAVFVVDHSGASMRVQRRL